MSEPTSAIESVLVENRVFPPREAMVKAARVSGMEGYNALCAEAEKDFEGFWARLARDLDVAKLDALTSEITLDDAVGVATELLAGKVRGRVVVRIA